IFFQAEDGIRDYKVTGVQTCALPISDFFNNYSDANGCGLFDLDQRIGDVDVGDKDGAAESARGIDGIGGRGIDLFDVMARSSDSDARRVGVDLNDLLSGGKVAGYARTDLDLTG